MTKISLLLAAALAAALVSLAGAASAETRIFLLENSDGYGVDTCLANGEPCGEQLASAWCRAHDYKAALDFGQVTGSTTDATGAVRPAGGITETAAPQATPLPAKAARAACVGKLCPSMVAITCSR